MLLAELLRDARSRLSAAGVPTPAADAELLAAHAFGLPRGELAGAVLRGAPVDGLPIAAFEELVAERARRVPLQHLTGTAPFRTVELAVGPGVFVPRPETEVVAGLAIEEALRLRQPLVVDLCTGSGAIAIAVAVEVPAARVVAVELDPLAHAWARRNVDELAPPSGPANDHAPRGLQDPRGLHDRRVWGGVDLRLGDAVGADTGVLAALAGAVDVVVANPPYIPDGARPVYVEVAEHDPATALYGGGEDGLGIARAVVAAAAGLLRPGG